MKLYQARSPMPPHAARGHAPRYEGYHRCKGRGDQVLTSTCHMYTTNESTACFLVNTLMIAIGGNFFLICVVLLFFLLLLLLLSSLLSSLSSSLLSSSLSSSWRSGSSSARESHLPSCASEVNAANGESQIGDLFISNDCEQRPRTTTANNDCERRTQTFCVRPERSFPDAMGLYL